MEAQRVAVLRVDPVQRNHMKVQIEIDRAAKALNERDDTAARATIPRQVRASDQRGFDRAHHYCQHPSHSLRAGGARGGVVTLIQRFGGAVNLNLHLRMVALDGLYTKDGDTLRFHEVSAPASTDMQRLLDAIVARVLRNRARDEGR